MAEFDREYARLVHRIYHHGAPKPSRQAGAATRSLTGAQIRAPVGALVDGRIVGFPALRCKRVAYLEVFTELAWFLRGSTSAAELDASGCRIWNADAAAAASRDPDLPAGELGPIYGHQWRMLPGHDQVAEAVALLATDPFSRRILVSAWNVADIPKMALPPCHYAFQFVCRAAAGGGVVVDCVVSMRSTDVGLGLPFNFVSYAMLTVLVCSSAGEACQHARKYAPGEVVVNMADCHIYEDHADALMRAVLYPVSALENIQLDVAGLTVERFTAMSRADLKGMFRPHYPVSRPPPLRLKLHA